MFSQLSLKWFALYYPLCGLFLLGSGVVLLYKKDAVLAYLQAQTNRENPPPLLRTILKYVFLFSLVCLVFSFFPFSWPELVFALWSLTIIYVAGSQLVRWPRIRLTINRYPDAVRTVIGKTGAIMLAVSPVMFLLSYIIIQKLTA